MSGRGTWMIDTVIGTAAIGTAAIGTAACLTPGHRAHAARERDE